MAFQAEIVPFTLRTGTGNQTVNLVRYPTMTAKGIIFLTSDNTGTNSEIYSCGISDGITNIGTGVGFTETFGVCLSARGYSGRYSLLTEQAQAFFGGAQMRMQGYVSAISAGSFQLTFDLNNTPGAQWYAIVIGGSDINVKVYSYDVYPGTGTENVGFDPVALFKVSAFTLGSTGEVAGAYHKYGFATPCDDMQVGWGCFAGSISSDAASWMIPTKIDAQFVSFPTNINNPASLSWVTNGFNVTGTFGPADFNIGYLAIGGNVAANLLPITQGTGVTATQCTPELVLFGSVCKPPNGSTTIGSPDFNFSFGATDGVSQIAQWIGLVNGAAFPFKRDRLSSTSKSIIMATATGASTSTINAQASCSLGGGNIDLTWSTNDGGGRVLYAMAIGNNPTPETVGPCGGSSPVPCIPTPDIPENVITTDDGVNITGF